MTEITINEGMVELIGLHSKLLSNAILTLQEIPTPIYYQNYLEFWCDCVGHHLA